MLGVKLKNVRLKKVELQGYQRPDDGGLAPSINKIGDEEVVTKN